MNAGRVPNTRGHEAREQLMATAERLFAEHGIDAVSMRAIATAAGLANHSAVQYHFGNKDELIAAILDWRRVGIDEARRRGLDEIAALPRMTRSERIEQVVRVLVRPLAALLDDPACHYLRFRRAVAQMSERDIAARYPIASDDVSGPVSGRAIAELIEAMKPVHHATASLRLSMSFAILIDTLAGRERLRDAGRAGSVTTERLFDELVGAMTAVLTRDTPTA